MDLPINHNKPLIMHIDLNSCFATIEQQANPLLRGKPLVVAAYETPNACIVAPSIEAKRFGIKTGMRIREARLLCSDIIVRTPDPEKYRDVHLKFKKIFQYYSPDVTPKSIDEAVIDFKLVENLRPDLVKIAREIKAKMKTEIGEWIICSIGISTNMFLAKLAASLHKPDGLDVIDHTNLLKTYGNTSLLDLNGISTKFQARLNMRGIFTPLDFFNAPNELLKKQVFQSVLGYYWFLRLRGYEIDLKEHKRGFFGQEYSLFRPTSDPKELSRIIMKLCEKMGRRMRRQDYKGEVIHIWCLYDDSTYWGRGGKLGTQMYTTQDFYRGAQIIMNQQPEIKRVTKIGVASSGLKKGSLGQIDLFTDKFVKESMITKTVDKINDTYGEFTVTPGIMMDMNDLVIDRIAFGGVKELEDLYNTSQAM